MNEAVSDMPGREDDMKKRSVQDDTEEASKRGDEQATEIARKLENDDMGGVSDHEGDSAGENKVETSLDEDW